MSTAEALAVVISGGIVPLAVWLAARTGWTGDRKRAAVAALSLVLGAVSAILTGALAVPEPAARVVGRVIVDAAAILTASQAAYKLFEPKLATSSDTATSATT